MSMNSGENVETIVSPMASAGRNSLPPCGSGWFCRSAEPLLAFSGLSDSAINVRPRGGEEHHAGYRDGTSVCWTDGFDGKLDRISERPPRDVFAFNCQV